MDRLIIMLACIILLASCGNRPSAPPKPPAMDTAVMKPISSALGLLPALRKTDSLQVLFYDNPDGDSLRYTRFYTFYNTNDRSAIDTVLNSIDKSWNERIGPVSSCRSEGKIHLYRGEEPVKTLYFSGRTQDCSYLYFIHNGKFYFFPNTPSVKSLLSDYRKKAVKPLATDETSL